MTTATALVFAKSPLLKQLTQPELSMSTLGDESIDALEQASLGHLQSLNLHDNFFSAADKQRLAATFAGVQLGEQRSGQRSVPMGE